jgi:hypothetical protein
VGELDRALDDFDVIFFFFSFLSIHDFWELDQVSEGDYSFDLSLLKFMIWEKLRQAIGSIGIFLFLFLSFISLF